MAKKERLLADLDWVTEKISSEIWTVNFATLGCTWALLVTSKDIAYTFRLSSDQARWIFIFCLAGLVTELLQHLSAYINARILLSTLESTERDDFQYDRTSLFYRFRIDFFYAKIILTLTGALWLLVTLASRFTS